MDTNQDVKEQKLGRLFYDFFSMKPYIKFQMFPVERNNVIFRLENLSDKFDKNLTATFIDIPALAQYIY